VPIRPSRPNISAKASIRTAAAPIQRFRQPSPAAAMTATIGSSASPAGCPSVASAIALPRLRVKERAMPVMEAWLIMPWPARRSPNSASTSKGVLPLSASSRQAPASRALAMTA
jgi:hypothetical protein